MDWDSTHGCKFTQTTISHLSTICIFILCLGVYVAIHISLCTILVMNMFVFIIFPFLVHVFSFFLFSIVLYTHEL